MNKANHKNLARKSFCSVITTIALFCCASVAIAQSEFQLTNEQLFLLNDQPYVPAENIALLNKDYPIPLLSFTVSASRLTTNTDQFSVVAVYQSMGFNLREKAYLIDAPSISGLDFTEAIKKRCQESPETFFGDMIVDGALGFNFNW